MRRRKPGREGGEAGTAGSQDIGSKWPFHRRLVALHRTMLKPYDPAPRNSSSKRSGWPEASPLMLPGLHSGLHVCEDSVDCHAPRTEMLARP